MSTQERNRLPATEEALLPTVIVVPAGNHLIALDPAELARYAQERGMDLGESRRWADERIREAVEIVRDVPPDGVIIVPPEHVTWWTCGRLAAGGASWEFRGVFDTRAKARQACDGAADFFAPVVLNRPLPASDGVPAGATFPAL